MHKLCFCKVESNKLLILKIVNTIRVSELCMLLLNREITLYFFTGNENVLLTVKSNRSSHYSTTPLL